MRRLIVANLLAIIAFTFAQEKMENEMNTSRNGHCKTAKEMKFV